MKKWEKFIDGTVASYHLTKKASPLWYAKVHKYGNGWTFQFGQRASIIKEDKDIIGEKNENYYSKKTWKSPESAKIAALEALRSHFITI